MSQYRVTFERVPLEIVVVLDAQDEDAAADQAWERATEYLHTVWGDGRGVTATASLDGIGADTVAEDQA